MESNETTTQHSTATQQPLSAECETTTQSILTADLFRKACQIINNADELDLPTMREQDIDYLILINKLPEK